MLSGDTAPQQTLLGTANPPARYAWGNLAHAVKTGESAFTHTHGMEALLANCRAAMAPGARVLIVELVITGVKIDAPASVIEARVA